MLDRYGYHSPVLFELRDYYIARCEELGQSTLSKIDCVYNSFSNGERITSAQRLLYRRRPDLMLAFPDPFDVSHPRRSYLHWYRMHGWKRNANPVMKIIRAHAPEPALRLARRARSAWRRFSVPA